MNEYDVKRLALVLAIQAEIEDAKLDNLIRIENGLLNVGLNYPPEWFYRKSQELRELANKHNEQL